MPFKIIGSSDPKYLAATDILIGDMSDTNYEFLLYNRPIILLANKWLKENFPDIGIKTNLESLNDAIQRSLKNPAEFQSARKEWLTKTIHKPDGHSAERVINTILQQAGIKNPEFIIIDGNDSVLRSNLNPLFQIIIQKGFKARMVSQVKEAKYDHIIYLSAHFQNLNFPGKGYRVHLDHGLKGLGTANVEMSQKDYQRNNYFPLIDLHITAGEMGQKRTTEILLGPNKGRAIVAGYPKADNLLKLNTLENKKTVMQELNFDIAKPLITYASAGEESYEKPGGSLSKDTIDYLKSISNNMDINILIKLKYPKPKIITRLIHFASKI